MKLRAPSLQGLEQRTRASSGMLEGDLPPQAQGPDWVSPDRLLGFEPLESMIVIRRRSLESLTITIF